MKLPKRDQIDAATARRMGDMFRNSGESVADGLLRGLVMAGGTPRQIAAAKRMIAKAKAEGNEATKPRLKLTGRRGRG